ncbi:uncharacterized protein BDZ99DRAFT_274823 [Mytilinidion resinicola]|uniref:Uncharacterized protein n=1 Tax=Mytilinidion resinicola TaxID=574789 RepID=A0A6A6YU15_9PEZI|nr:uncharacterized protein BDZ99DRAFT_274823 [Mytilinidion resinicola]KAF2811407.1 hypothetical protein BDZ99DRAFT_274823 [Mytilinidion resinicola]
MPATPSLYVGDREPYELLILGCSCYNPSYCEPEGFTPEPPRRPERRAALENEGQDDSLEVERREQQAELDELYEEERVASQMKQESEAAENGDTKQNCEVEQEDDIEQKNEMRQDGQDYDWY